MSIRVAFVLHAMQVAGAEVLVAETIRALKGKIDPTILCLDGVGPIGEQMIAEGVPLVQLGRKPGRDWNVAWRMAAEIRKRGVRVVHAHQYSPFFYAALAKARNRNGFKLIFTEHGRHYPDVVSPKRRAINRLFLDKQADAVNACCRFSAKALCEIDGFRGNRIEVIENGIYISRYEGGNRKELRAKLDLKPDRKYIACVARFHPVKDHAMLLRAFTRLAKERDDVDLLLVGDGQLRPQLRDQVQAAELEKRVRFLGVRSDVPDILRAVDAFALTSVSEAASLTVLEAMACGLPVVVTKVGGNPEMVRDGIDGILVPRGDDAACANALKRVLEPNAMGEAGRQRVRERYSLQRTIQKYHALYKQLG